MADKQIKKYGFIPDILKDGDFVFGGGFIGTKEINPSGDWSAFLVKDEVQNKNQTETMACTTFGTINAIEVLMYFIFKQEFNFSERFIAILSGTNQGGNNPHTVAETIRKKGLINEIDLPFDDSITTWDKFYSPWPMLKNLLNKGRKWLEEYDLKHEYVWTGDPLVAEKKRLIELALKRSPIAISVYAWSGQENGIFQQLGSDNHWCLCYKIDENGNYCVFDSYDQTHKVYSGEADIKSAKIYWITKLDHKPTLLEKMLKLLKLQ